MHPWYSRVHNFTACKEIANESKKAGELVLEDSKCGLAIPDFVIFDLDPYTYSGKEEKGQEPEYNVKGFKEAAEIAFVLKDFLDGFGIKSYVKTSGKTGLHVFVPVAPNYTYDQTRAFAEIVGKILESRTKKKITLEWSTEKRRGKVFFDFNQNAMGKTIASIFSARPTASATVSMPIAWKRLDQVVPTDYTMLNVLPQLEKIGDAWNDILLQNQDLAALLNQVSNLE
jgi:bifunctional non-homologous end joining protein LigD